MAELETIIKELDTVVAKIKEVNQKVKDMLKKVVLEGNKLDKLTVKAMKKKIPNTTDKLATRLLNVQKDALINPQFKPQGFATTEVWSKDPKMFEQLKNKTKQIPIEDQQPTSDKSCEAAPVKGQQKKSVMAQVTPRETFSQGEGLSLKGPVDDGGIHIT
ncbi:hypothetical protein DSO57_1014829 [Entomophthora muscae]|uniref:Uncharacterized protein n=1 Tax=Entomophthora muscae TaxID=34485 RepID=A0ACC2RK03_9FUNG|nr:hypothetical protein DSO57_1014829 [Entomophthora muscae]